MSRPSLRCFALIGFIFIAGCTPPKTEPAPPPTGQEMQVKAGDLIKDYQSNALAADNKYKGKRMTISGKVGSVQKAPLYGYVLQLMPEDAGDFDVTSLTCILGHEPPPEAAALKEGDAVKVTGTCDGEVVGQLKISKCVLAK